MKYTLIVVKSFAHKFASVVEKHLNDGWELIGDVMIRELMDSDRDREVYFFQAMIKKEG